MKKIILIAAIFIYANSFSQIDTSIRFWLADTNRVSFKFAQIRVRNLMFIDNAGTTAEIDSSGKLIVYDSLRTINILLMILGRYQPDLKSNWPKYFDPEFFINPKKKNHDRTTN